MNAVYWGVTALCIMKHKDALDAEETIQYVMSCWDDEAGTPRYSHSLFDRLTPNRRRRIRRSPRTRRAHPLDAQRHPGPRNPRRPRAPRRTARDRLYVPSPPRRHHIAHPRGSKSSCACSSPWASSPATHSARPTRASSTAPCPRYRCSARSTGSIARAPWRTSPRAAISTGALGASRAPRATRRKVRPLPSRPRWMDRPLNPVNARAQYGCARLHLRSSIDWT